MWTILKYVVDSPNPENKEVPEPVNESPEDVGFEQVLNTIKGEIQKNAENYVISLHYLDVPIVLHFGVDKLKETHHLKIYRERLDETKEVRKILLMNEDDYVQGFLFLRKQVAVQKDILNSLDLDTFDKKASESGFEPYLINDLRTIWKNKRLESLQAALAHHVDTYYKPKLDHPLCEAFVTYLENIYKRGVDRFKTFICIGSTFIGKSVFFSKFIVPEEYYVYHSNYLEYSKMPNQPQKIFRILDDINWDQVTSTELKSLMNRNISSVNIKYGYEYIFPLIPIIIMNAEDYKTFRQHFSDIWTFIERNAVIYPPQTGKEVREENESLFTCTVMDESDPESYLFNKILDVKRLKECRMNNMNEWIKKELNTTESWKYDTTRYIPFPEKQSFKIPNPELSRKTIMKQYEEYILRRKKREMENEGKEEEKGPKKPWYKMFPSPKRQQYQPKRRVKPTRFDDLDVDKFDDDESEYKGKKKSKYDDDDDDDDESMSETGESDDESGSESSMKYGGDFVEL